MRNFRVTPIMIAILGVILCIASPLLIWFLLISPVMAQITEENAQLAPVEQYVGVSNPPDLQAAKKTLAANQAKAQVIRQQWASIQTAKNPLIQSADKWRSWDEWIAFLEFEFAPEINRFLHTSTAQPLTMVASVDPPSSPDKVPTGIVAMPLGTIAVFGSYNQILKQVESWNHFNRIVLVDGLSLQGYSPFMTGSYNATEYIYTESASGLPSTAPPSTPATPGGSSGAGPGASAPGGAPPNASGQGGGSFGAPGQGGGETGTPLPPPPSVPANFEDVPEFHVHIANPKSVGAGTVGANPGGRGQGGR